MCVARASILIYMKKILTIFEIMSRLRISYIKSKIISINLEEHELQGVAVVVGCPVGVFPIKYLGP